MRHLLFIVCFLYLSFTSCTQPEIKKPETSPWAKNNQPPKRVLILLFEGLREEWIEKYDLTNFKELKEKSLSYQNAIIGHLSASMPVSHFVIETGKLPRALPFQDSIFNDTLGQLGKKGILYPIGNLSEEKIRKILSPFQETSLQLKLKKQNEGSTHVFSLSEISALTLAGTYSDSAVFLGGPRLKKPFIDWCEPQGNEVYDYLKFPAGNRFYIPCKNLFNLENKLGFTNANRYILGPSNEHTGGDSWLVDAALETMKVELDWRALSISFGSTLKILELLAEHETSTTEKWAIENKITLKDTLHIADKSLGKILNYLKEINILNETLIVLTSSTGSQFNQHTIPPLPAQFESLSKGNSIKSEQLNSLVKFWLKNSDAISQMKFTTLLKSIPGVAEIYTKQSTGNNIHFIRTYRSPKLQNQELVWAQNRHQELLETMASKNSADVVGLLFNKTGFGKHFDTSGAQEEIQRIPLFIWSPNLYTNEPKLNLMITPKGPRTEMLTRLVDINPIITEIMKLPGESGLDGSKISISSLLAP